MASIAQEKIIHRFIRPISDYEEGGEYFYQVIPLDTQAFAIYPKGQREVDLFYVIGDGLHTYTEIRAGLGTTEASAEYPMISTKNIEGFMRKSDDPNTLYSVDDEGNTVNIPKSTFVFTTDEPNIVYGTDESGNQTTLNTTSFGKVDDVKVGETSVVTNKIATLGTMAGENKNDYSTKAIADTLYADISYENTVNLHIDNTNNPHQVTKTQIGLGNVDNTSDIDKPISTAVQTALNDRVIKNEAIVGATHTKITYDSKGLVTNGSDLQESDIPSLSLSKISDVTASATELNILDGATVTTAELNVLDGITATTIELNYVDGVTSSIQTQLNDKITKTTDPSILYGTDESGEQTLISIDDLASVKLLLTDINILSSGWIARPVVNNVIYEFPYQYIIANINITEDMIPEVTFAEKEASSGLLSPVCLAENGKLYIYAREIINYNFTIPNVVFFTGETQS